MSVKTNKALLKRVKITRRGKILARRAGHNHFNAKAARTKQLARKGLIALTLKTKDLNRYLPHQV